MSSEKYLFFWKADSPFSQWHPSVFRANPLFGPDKDKTIAFHNCEQWMMYHKAALFNDRESLKLIVNTLDPKLCKAYGRRVKNFDNDEWWKHNREVIWQGTLAEASPFDCYYGIGLSVDDPRARNRKMWRGKNLLGDVLTELRDHLQGQSRT